MNWEKLILWVIRFDGNLTTARRWYRMAMEDGAVIDIEKLREAAKGVKE